MLKRPKDANRGQLDASPLVPKILTSFSLLQDLSRASKRWRSRWRRQGGWLELRLPLFIYPEKISTFRFRLRQSNLSNVRLINDCDSCALATQKEALNTPPNSPRPRNALSQDPLSRESVWSSNVTSYFVQRVHTSSDGCHGYGDSSR